MMQEIMLICYYLGVGMVIFGSIFLFLGALGIFRLPDVYNRLQAGTKATTLGAFSSIVGIGLMEPAWFPKAFIIALFLLMTNPISSHALARASYRRGVKLWKGSVVDKYGPYLREKKEEGKK
jgi:multicomponent Na+:H+ antiporter subunit G